MRLHILTYKRPPEDVEVVRSSFENDEGDNFGFGKGICHHK